MTAGRTAATDVRTPRPSSQRVALASRNRAEKTLLGYAELVERVARRHIRNAIRARRKMRRRHEEADLIRAQGHAVRTPCLDLRALRSRLQPQPRLLHQRLVQLEELPSGRYQ